MDTCLDDWANQTFTGICIPKCDEILYVYGDSTKLCCAVPVTIWLSRGFRHHERKTARVECGSTRHDGCNSGGDFVSPRKRIDLVNSNMSIGYLTFFFFGLLSKCWSSSTTDVWQYSLIRSQRSRGVRALRDPFLCSLRFSPCRFYKATTISKSVFSLSFTRSCFGGCRLLMCWNSRIDARVFRLHTSCTSML